MELTGCDPKSSCGERFYIGFDGWQRLWRYCAEVSAVAARVGRNSPNEGSGLNSSDAQALSEVLGREYRAGRTADYAAAEAVTALPVHLPFGTCLECERDGELNLPDTVDARGVPLKFADRRAFGDPPTRCNRCKGSGTWGTVDEWVAGLLADADEFRLFLGECGGFKS